jgi:hypothetical protein
MAQNHRTQINGTTRRSYIRSDAGYHLTDESTLFPTRPLKSRGDFKNSSYCSSQMRTNRHSPIPQGYHKRPTYRGNQERPALADLAHQSRHRHRPIAPAPQRRGSSSQGLRAYVRHKIQARSMPRSAWAQTLPARHRYADKGTVAAGGCGALECQQLRKQMKISLLQQSQPSFHYQTLRSRGYPHGTGARWDMMTLFQKRIERGRLSALWGKRRKRRRRTQGWSSLRKTCSSSIDALESHARR